MVPRNPARVAACCERCGYEWFSRTATPVRCPYCGSRSWNKPRVYKLAGKPEPTRKAKARGVAYDSQTGADAANIRYEQERAGESPRPNAPPDTRVEKE